MAEIKNYLVTKLDGVKLYTSYDEKPKVGDVVLADHPKDPYSYIGVIQLSRIGANQTEEFLIKFLNPRFGIAWIKYFDVDPMEFMVGEEIMFFEAGKGVVALSGEIKEADFNKSEVLVSHNGKTKTIDWTDVAVWRN